MKIILHGACSFPFFYKEMIPVARQTNPDLEWRAMILSWRHQELFRGVLPEEHVFYVQPAVNAAFKEGGRPEDLRHYAGSIYTSMQTDKGEPGQLRGRQGAYQLQNAIAFYKVYKKYLEDEKPDAILLPALETHESMILYDIARDMGIKALIPTSTRNFDGWYFSATPNEDLPPYAFKETLSPELLSRAKELIGRFQKDPTGKFSSVSLPPAEDLLPPPPRRSLSRNLITGAVPAFLNVLRDLSSEPHAMRSNPFWYQPRVQLLNALSALRELKGNRQRRYFHIRRLDQLPKAFIYFPLQVSPESSINTLAPYFVDQQRAIDFILYHMPSDHQLVVKEHPHMKGIRSNDFYRRLQQTPGVLMADYTLPSHELVRRAALTVSVTGTAAFEALLFGRPSLSIGKTFFSPWLMRSDSFATLSENIRNATSEPPEAIAARATECIARMLVSGYDYVLTDPYNPWLDSRYVMNRRNIREFLNALTDHFKRLARTSA